MPQNRLITYNKHKIEKMPITVDGTMLFQDKFILEHSEGNGAFGIVVKAIDKETMQYCAIKIDILLDHMQIQSIPLKASTHQRGSKYHENAGSSQCYQIG